MPDQGRPSQHADAHLRALCRRWAAAGQRAFRRPAARAAVIWLLHDWLAAREPGAHAQANTGGAGRCICAPVRPRHTLLARASHSSRGRGQGTDGASSSWRHSACAPASAASSQRGGTGECKGGGGARLDTRCGSARAAAGALACCPYGRLAWCFSLTEHRVHPSQPHPVPVQARHGAAQGGPPQQRDAAQGGHLLHATQLHAVAQQPQQVHGTHTRAAPPDSRAASACNAGTCCRMCHLLARPRLCARWARPAGARRAWRSCWTPA